MRRDVVYCSMQKKAFTNINTFMKYRELLIVLCTLSSLPFVKEEQMVPVCNPKTTAPLCDVKMASRQRFRIALFSVKKLQEGRWAKMCSRCKRKDRCALDLKHLFLTLSCRVSSANQPRRHLKV